MSPKLELEFIKRLLTDTVNDERIRNDFFENNIFPISAKIIDIIKEPIEEKRNEGLDWPERAHTMIGKKRLDALHANLDYIRENNIEGHFVETGVWRGGASIFMAYYNKLYKLDRNIYVCDSFEGLPIPDIDKYPVDKGDQHHTIEFLKVSMEEVMANFARYDCLHDNIFFVKGWFSESLILEDMDIPIALLRFDGDMYGSTMDVLNNLYCKIVDKGILIIDDYCLPNCIKAVSDFRLKNNISNEINRIDSCGIYWYK